MDDLGVAPFQETSMWKEDEKCRSKDSCRYTSTYIYEYYMIEYNRLQYVDHNTIYHTRIELPHYILYSTLFNHTILYYSIVPYDVE